MSAEDRKLCKESTTNQFNSQNMQSKPTQKALQCVLVAVGLGAASLQAQTKIPSTYVLPASAADTTQPGFIFNVSEVLSTEPNRLDWAELQLAGQEGQNFADPSAQAEDASAPGTPLNPPNGPVSFIVPTTINFNIVDGSTAPVNTNLVGVTQENLVPGTPGTGGNNGTDNIAAEALTYLLLPAGTNTMGVRSDDGFRVIIGGAAPTDKYSSAATVVGQFDGGRGYGDTIFKFVIQQPGLYAARLLWENGGGDASVEWFTAKSDGTYALVNDVANGGIPAYRAVTSAGAAYVSNILPAPGSVGASPEPLIQVVIVDGATPIDGSKVALTFNGAPVTPSVTRSGNSTTVSYTGSTLLTANTLQSASVTFADGTTSRTNSWTFTTGNFVTLPAGTAVTPKTSSPGFKFSIFANAAATADNDEAYNNDYRDNAEQSLNMIYHDWSDQTVNPLPLLANLADVNAAAGTATGPAPALGAANAPAEFEIAGTINFTATTTPGLPSTDAKTDFANGELLTYVSLPAGLTTFVVSSPDLYRVYFGSWDATTGLLAAHLNVYGPSDTSFFVVAPTAGVYPMRLIWNHVTGSDPGLKIYTTDSSGAQHLLNDTGHSGLATYRALASPSEPYIKFTSPSTWMHQLINPSSALVVNIADGDVGVDDSSPALTLDGKTVTITKNRVGDILAVTYTPTTLQVPTEMHTATLAFKDKGGKSLSETWSFMNLKSTWLPASPLTGDNFDSYPGDGTVFNTPSTEWSTNWSNPVQTDASSWYVYSYTFRETQGENLDDVDSDSYMSWVVVPFDTFTGKEGDIANINPQETLNGQPVTTLASGNILAAESDNRSGSVMAGQVQFAYSKAFDLSSVANPVLSWSSLKKQNQDDFGGIEYSVDGGTNWAPVIYYIDGGHFNDNPPDTSLNNDGSADAVTTFNHLQGDVPVWTDWKGNTKGGNFGDGIASPITQALGPFIAPRINDNHFEGRRIEAVRLPLAANKKDVRLRLVQLGTCSWYFAVDNIAFYDIAPSGAVVPTGIQSSGPTPLINGITLSANQVTVTWQGGTLESTPSLTNPVWTSLGTSGTHTEPATGNKFFRVQQ